MTVSGKAASNRRLRDSDVRRIIEEAFAPVDVSQKDVLVIIPDGTRSGPIDLFFRLFYDVLGDEVGSLDYLIALGTHQPMSDEAIRAHLGVSAEEMVSRYPKTEVFNHDWKDAGGLETLGTIPASELGRLSDGLFSQDLPVTVNRRIFDYDHIVVCGPVFPHEVVGVSGGTKYFFPGISGSEMIDATHWLGAVITTNRVLGRKRTPVRAIIDRGAALIDRPQTFCCFVVKDDALAGLYAGTPQEAWSEAADLSSSVHVRYMKHRYRQVVSVMPEMYDDIWTASKGMFKVEPVVEDGGEIIIYAPHINEFSYTHGEVLDQLGYHVRDYYLKQWDRFKQYPPCVLAHSTHLSGTGTYEGGTERRRVRVSLATGIPRERCERMSIGYRDPSRIDPASWGAGDEEEVLVVPHAGEILYRLEEEEPR
jgi:nickel-dependent lactate racemase